MFMFRNWMLLGAAVLLSGCVGTSPTPHFYVLNAPSDDAVENAHGSVGSTIGIAPIVLPDIVKRPQIISREGLYSVSLSEFHRWAGDLSANMTRVVGRVVKEQLGGDRVVSYPWPRSRQPDIQIHIDVTRFDGSLGGDAVLTGSWTMINAKDEAIVTAFSLVEPSTGVEYPHLVAAL